MDDHEHEVEKYLHVLKCMSELITINRSSSSKLLRVGNLHFNFAPVLGDLSYIDCHASFAKNFVFFEGMGGEQLTLCTKCPGCTCMS